MKPKKEGGGRRRRRTRIREKRKILGFMWIKLIDLRYEESHKLFRKILEEFLL